MKRKVLEHSVVWLLIPLVRVLNRLLPPIPVRPIESDPNWDEVPAGTLSFPCQWCGAARCDCIERINCLQEGALGHDGCGWCSVHGGPRFQCLGQAHVARRSR